MPGTTGSPILLECAQPLNTRLPVPASPAESSSFIPPLTLGSGLRPIPESAEHCRGAQYSGEESLASTRVF